MTTILYIGHDPNTATPVHIHRENDFARLLDERLGRDAMDYFNAIVKARDAAIARSDEAYQGGLIRGLILGESKEKNND